MNLKRIYCLDVETNGPIIAKHSMISFALSCVGDVNTGFYGELRPISDDYIPEALAVSGFTHEQTKNFQSPEDVMKSFSDFLDSLSNDKIIIFSDNPGYDWGWLNWYMHTFLGSNRLGHSCRCIGELWCGMQRSLQKRSGWKRFKITPHTHNAFDDAKGNAEALNRMLTSL